ncbi:MAG: hypothetical protein IKF05_04860 [Erysipelotrichaceae bacterium]|nr:hypothetical protein [Erysipelotrichaceae bacterium]
MDRTAVAYLIGQTYTTDQFGVQWPEETKQKIYCNVSSVSASEWFEGGRNGLNPELRITTFSADYSGEKIVEYNGARFTVYRTYLTRNDVIELYCERRKGNADGGE